VAYHGGNHSLIGEPKESGNKAIHIIFNSNEDKSIKQKQCNQESKMEPSLGACPLSSGVPIT